MMSVRATLILALALGLVALPAGCGGDASDRSSSGASKLDARTRQHTFDEAKNVCAELGLAAVAKEYGAPPEREAAARAYANKFLAPYRDTIYRGCRAGLAPLPPDQVRCARLKTRSATRELARQLVDRVVAPEAQSERETIRIIAESLYATCRQPRLPGVGDAGRYKPVKPVLAQVQRDFDEHEIAGD